MLPKRAIQTITGTTAPGIDGMMNEMLLDDEHHLMKRYCCEMIMLSFKQKFYDFWKIIELRPISKVSRYLQDPGGWRPISLLSVMSKLLERVMALRLEKVLQSKPTPPGFYDYTCDVS